MTPATVVHLAEVGSTNDEALARFCDQPLWVRADVQTKGRGRRGRPWSSPAGNLYASYATALPEDIASDAFAILPLVAAVALAEAIEASTCARAQLKWPNDVLIGGEKTAGILLEAAGPPRRVVVGFGVNVAHVPDLPGATCLTRHDPTATADALFAALADRLPTMVATLSRPEALTDVRRRWLAKAVGIGGPVTVRLEASTREGRFVGLDPAGRLILGDGAGGTSLIAAGDVFLRGEATAASEKGPS